MAELLDVNDASFEQAVARAALPELVRPLLQAEVTGSDHCPAGVDGDPEILR